MKRMILLLLICLNPRVFGQVEESLVLNAVEIEHYHFSEVHKDAQVWSALYVASNGKIYTGLCTHGDGANLYEFDPKTETMRHLSNITELANERGHGIWTNGKIHVQMQELDGYIYFGTLCEDNGPPAIDPHSYKGPFWGRIEMATGNVELLSYINSFWGLLGQCMDKERRMIYGLAENGNLYKYAIDENWTEDLGRVDDWDICRTIFADDLGNVYGTRVPGRVWRYDPAQDRIFDLSIRLPIVNVSRSMHNPMLDRKAQWRIIEWDPQTKCAYGIVGGSNDLFKYDVHKGDEGEFQVLTRMCAPMFRNDDPFKIPHATLAMTISHKERKIYYLPVISGDFDYGAVKLDVAVSNSLKKRNGMKRSMPSLSYMVSYDMETGQRTDIGLLKTRDGRLALGLGGAQADSSGNIWFVGAFEENDPKYKAREISGMGYSLGLGYYDPFR